MSIEDFVPADGNLPSVAQLQAYADSFAEEIAIKERERIIKQLEYFGTDNGKPFNPFHCDLCLTLASLIAIIKGESK